MLTRCIALRAMKRILLLVLLLFFAVDARRGQSGARKVGGGDEGLRVQATGVASGQPDAVSIEYTVTAIKDTNEEALKSVSTTARSIKAKLGTLAIGDKYQSTQLHTSPEYKYSQKTKESQLVGYRATQSYTLVVKGVGSETSSLADRSSSAVGRIVQAGGNEVRVENVTPIILDKAKIAKAAREAAVKNAVEKANDYAQLLETTLGTVVYVNEIHAPESRGQSNMLLRSRSFAAAEADEGPPDVNIDLGEKETSVSVEIKWSLGGGGEPPSN